MPCHYVNIPWGTNREGRNWTKSVRDHDGQNAYCPQTTICALEMRGVCTPRFRSFLCPQVSLSKSSFSFPPLMTSPHHPQWQTENITQVMNGVSLSTDSPLSMERNEMIYVVAKMKFTIISQSINKAFNSSLALISRGFVVFRSRLFL